MTPTSLSYQIILTIISWSFTLGADDNAQRALSHGDATTGPPIPFFEHWQVLSPLVKYVKFPEKGHWWDGAMVTELMVEFFDEYVQL